jgi:hypothetical protein
MALRRLRYEAFDGSETDQVPAIHEDGRAAS